ncbi:MAG: glutamine synthetase family protein [Clostridiales bacterium]|nr:glutamine synthetase family protein [Clostridiales bacterium]
MPSITVREAMAYVQKNDVKFIRLAFCDLFGAQKNLSIMPNELPKAFESGVSLDASGIKGFSDVTSSDLSLFPDPDTLGALPWRPGPGRVARFFCDIRHPDGTPFSGDCRNVLKNAVMHAQRLKLESKIGVECEFYLFKTDENGEPVDQTLDRGGYLDIAPLDRGEDIRREICLNLQEMGLSPERSHHKQGPGQNEIDFKFSDVMTSADNLLAFKALVKAIASRNGLFASFMPKPLIGKSGNGLHVNLSLTSGGENIFRRKDLAGSAGRFIAGVLARVPEASVFLNPLANSYERFGSFEAPKYVSWSFQNLSQLLRVPARQSENARMELRSTDPSINPYLAFALILEAGLEGIEKGLELPPPLDEDLCSNESAAKGLAMLPLSLEEALKLAQESEFIKKSLPEQIRVNYLKLKKVEAAEFAAVANKEAFYKHAYFGAV